MIWKTGRFQPLAPDVVGQLDRTFERRSEIAVVVAAVRRKAMVEVPEIAEEDCHDTQVPAKRVSKCPGRQHS
jgi:hypothetical protein